jgi:hypothetical protein
MPAAYVRVHFPSSQYCSDTFGAIIWVSSLPSPHRLKLWHLRNVDAKITQQPNTDLENDLCGSIGDWLSVIFKIGSLFLEALPSPCSLSGQRRSSPKIWEGHFPSWEGFQGPSFHQPEVWFTGTICGKTNGPSGCAGQMQGKKERRRKNGGRQISKLINTQVTYNEWTNKNSSQEGGRCPEMVMLKWKGWHFLSFSSF